MHVLVSNMADNPRVNLTCFFADTILNVFPACWSKFKNKKWMNIFLTSDNSLIITKHLSSNHYIPDKLFSKSENCVSAATMVKEEEIPTSLCVSNPDQNELRMPEKCSRGKIQNGGWVENIHMSNLWAFLKLNWLRFLELVNIKNKSKIMTQSIVIQGKNRIQFQFTVPIIFA